MSSFIQQLPALIGVVIGALGSYLAIVRGDRVRFRREQTARWDERRLAVYSDYARTLKKTITLNYRVAAHLGNDPNRHPLTPEDAAPQLAAALDARDPAWEALLMLGAPDVVDRAREWVLAAIEMERFLEAGVHDPDGWSALLARQRVARDRYYVAVRSDLALPPGHSGRWTLDRSDPGA
ncbi:hypothetical protein O1Q96_36375 [Streptomyces sp. Qhu-G9]|uniref:hypothetical protein n=1 Tax=Streptomyces sp. Qhu-G9 TaxID=3452799 RepID=UPI0022AC264A|nr:hypothetical protein [Streptomyces aurantiacus]WAU84689.1 hypothetical protein O1Q96_36375 [Streptomyces aurantiacus]